MLIYGDLNSGNCLKVKWVCDHLALPYRWIATDTMTGETRSPEFLARNPMGQVPMVILDDGRALAQSNAIIRYLARDSALVPTDPFAAATVDAWLFWEQNSHEPFIATSRYHMVYLRKPASARDSDKVRRGEAALATMERRLTDQAYFAGDGFTIADIALLAYTRLAGEGGFDLAPFAAVRRWIAVCEALLHLNPAPVRVAS